MTLLYRLKHRHEFVRANFRVLLLRVGGLTLATVSFITLFHIPRYTQSKPVIWSLSMLVFSVFAFTFVFSLLAFRRALCKHRQQDEIVAAFVADHLPLSEESVVRTPKRK